MAEFKFDASWDAQDQQRNHNELVDGEVVLWRNDQWRVTNFYLEEKANPNVMGPPYDIAVVDLASPEILEHVSRKTWVDRELFAEAYQAACRLHEIVPYAYTERYLPGVEKFIFGLRDDLMAAQQAVRTRLDDLTDDELTEIMDALARGWDGGLGLEPVLQSVIEEAFIERRRITPAEKSVGYTAHHVKLLPDNDDSPW